MRLPLLARALLCGLAAMALAPRAQAQSAACERYRAELASLDRGGGRSQDAAQRQRSEIARITGYYRSIGCDGGRFLFFGSSPPAECAAIAQRIGAMEANYNRLAAGEFIEVDAVVRRQQLVAAIGQFCREDRDQGLGRLGDPFEERLPPRGEETVQDRGFLDDDPFHRPAFGSGRTVCVNTCDGSFFPLETAFGSERADDMCQARCPGAEARAYAMPHGPSSLDEAVSPRGDRYADLPNAFRFQKKFDASCACRRDGESWAQILQRAESMLDRHGGDVVVTAEKAEELSRPRADRRGPARDGRERKGKVEKGTPPAAKPEAGPAGAAEPGGPSSKPVLGHKDAGRTPAQPHQHQNAARGEARPRVRVVAPGILPVPGQAQPKTP
jgi:hypothetical protein